MELLVSVDLVLLEVECCFEGYVIPKNRPGRIAADVLPMGGANLGRRRIDVTQKCGYFKDFSKHLRFRYLGLGFLWAWIYATWFTPVVFPESSGFTIGNDVSWLLSSATVALTLFGTPVLLKDRDVSSIGWMRVLAGPLTTIGSVMMAAEPLFGVASPLLTWIGGVLTGLFSGWLWMLWGDFTGKVDQELAELFVPWCVAVPLAILFTCAFVVGPMAGIAVCLLPLISGVLLCMSLHDEAAIDPVPLLPSEQRPKYAGDFVRVGLGSLAIYACLGFAWGNMDYSSMVGWGDTHLVAYVIGAALALGIAVLSISYSTRLDLFGMYRWLVPLILFGFVFLCIDSPWTRLLSLACITAAQYGFDIIVWIYFSRIVRKGVCSGSLAIGINRGFVQAGVLVGSLIAMVAPRFIERTAVSFELLCLIMCASMTTMVLMLLNRKDHLERITVDSPAAQSAGMDGRHSDCDVVCDALAIEHALTAREREILGYLIRGRSLPYVRDALVLSKNTVDTHAKNLYRKLGVHSRQELLDLVEGEGQK